MRADELLQRIGENISVRRVFGEPVERDGTTVIPVAMVCGGAGGGVDADDASGSGFGVWSRGVGVYTIRHGEVRFVPATDQTALIALGMLIGARLITRQLRARSGRRRRSGQASR
jgi:uncharacterized spore protein YtfJ